MRLKITEKRELEVTCSGKTKKDLLADLSEAVRFVGENFDVIAPKKKKKKVKAAPAAKKLVLGKTGLKMPTVAPVTAKPTE